MSIARMACRRSALAFALLMLVALVSVATAQASARLEFLGLAGPIPGTWQSEAPASSMRLAQFRLPGDPHAQLVVYYFGQGQGGSAELNIARWASQFSTAEGNTVQPVVRLVRDAGPRVTLVRLHGTYRRGVGAAAGAVARPDQTLLAAIVETPRGNAFVQVFGERATVDLHDEAFEAFLFALGPARGS
jgi:hypothetical protein